MVFICRYFQKLKKDSFFDLEIIAFGTHLSKNHGYTVSDIENGGFKIIHKIKFLYNDDSQKGVFSYANTILQFSEFWENHIFDLVLCLGDRFEMSAAHSSIYPFWCKVSSHSWWGNHIRCNR